MRVKLKNNYYDEFSAEMTLPASPMELYDMLDRLGVENRFDNVYISIFDEYIPKAMREGGFYDDIFILNLLAQRIEGMSEAETAGFTAVLLDNEDFSLPDLVLVTYGIDVYPIYPCRDHAEYGEIVIDNEMIPEVESCPDELIDYLDTEAIGRLAAQRNKGVFVGNFYCEVADYTPPDIEITIEKPDRRAFQVLIGTDAKTSQWYTLPCAENITHKSTYGIISPLPNIRMVDDIIKLNELAEKVAALERGDFIKLKAVMESNLLRGSSGALFALKSLDKFDLDISVRNVKDYGRKYLAAQLPEGFDTKVFSSEYLSDVGSNVLDCKSGSMTSYGIISGSGQELYSKINASQELSDTEDETDELEVSLT